MGEERTETPLRLTFFRELSDERMLCVPVAGHQALDRLFCFAPLPLGQHMLDNARVADAHLSSEHRAERLQALAHLTQRDNGTSVVALGFRFVEQLPRLALHAPHFVKQVVSKPFFPPLARLHDGLRDVVFVTV